MDFIFNLKSRWNIKKLIDYFIKHTLWNIQKIFELDSLKIVEAFAFWICQKVKKVKVKKYTVENTPYKVFKCYRNLHVAW